MLSLFGQNIYQIYSILQNECQTRPTRVQYKKPKCDTSATRTTRVRHECYKNGTSAARVKNSDSENDTSESIISHHSISCMANERLRGDEQFHSKNYLLEMPCSHVKTHLKSAPRKLNFVMAKAILKSYTLDFSYKCSSTFPHSYA